MLQLLENVCDEVARNGFKKIILLNCHGGNYNLAPFFAQCNLAEKKDYIIYISWCCMQNYSKAVKRKVNELFYGHGGEGETAHMLAVNPKLVKMKDAWKKGAWPLKRLNYKRGLLYTGIWWYSDYPEHYCGNGLTATRKLGKKMLKMDVDATIDAIKTVKKDNEALRLQNEFFTRVDKLTSTY